MSDRPTAPGKSPRIYVSYRRGDTSGYAGRLYQNLIRHFGAGRVLRNIDDINPGYGFDEVVKEVVSSSAAVVVLIGRSWLNGAAGEASPACDLDDFVCLEIATALEKGIPVIPVLVQGATMPGPEVLPDAIAPLSGGQTPLEIWESSWTVGVGHLIEWLSDRLRSPTPEEVARAAAKPESLRVFVTAAGRWSLKMVEVVSDFLPELLPSTEIVKADEVKARLAEAGTNLVEELSPVDAAVVCLYGAEAVTQSLNMEVGVLYGLRKNISVYLLDADYSELPPPLSYFFGLKADLFGTRWLLSPLNGLRAQPAPADELTASFQSRWPLIEERFFEISFRAKRARERATQPPPSPPADADAEDESPAAEVAAPEPQEDERIFVCYARADQEFALKLATSLKDRGVPLWLDQWDIPESADWDRSIDEALYGCSRFLIVLSPASVTSDEVRAELRIALDEKKTIFPVLYRKCAVPRRLRLIQHFDFTAHEPDDGTAVGRLARSLTTGRR